MVPRPINIPNYNTVIFEKLSTGNRNGYFSVNLWKNDLNSAKMIAMPYNSELPAIGVKTARFADMPMKGYCEDL
jgi:hypothetical protein